MTSDLSAEDLPFEVQYTSAIIHLLKNHGFESVAALEKGTQGKVDIYCVQGGTTFAIEAVMAERSPAEIAEHRSRFDNMSRPNYQRAAKKCLVIIGKLDSVRKHVREVQGGIEVVGLAPNEGVVKHEGYTVCVKEGEGVVEFNIECDGVAKEVDLPQQNASFRGSPEVTVHRARLGCTEADELTDIHVSSFHDVNCGWSVAVSLAFFLTSC